MLPVPIPQPTERVGRAKRILANTPSGRHGHTSLHPQLPSTFLGVVPSATNLASRLHQQLPIRRVLHAVLVAALAVAQVPDVALARPVSGQFVPALRAPVTRLLSSSGSHFDLLRSNTTHASPFIPSIARKSQNDTPRPIGATASQSRKRSVCISRPAHRRIRTTPASPAAASPAGRRARRRPPSSSPRHAPARTPRAARPRPRGGPSP